MHVREHSCLHVWKPQRLNHLLSQEALQRRWAYWKRLAASTRARGSLCMKHPARVIRSVFPDSVEELAIRVARCESDHGIYLNVYAKNPSSTASGLFQLLDGWWYGRANPFDPWANTRIAYKIWRSNGGSFYGDWSASAGCWG